MAFTTWMPTVDESVQLLAPRARVKPVGAELNFEMVPSAEVAAAVPVPEVVPPALSTVRLMLLATVAVTVRVPEPVAANERAENKLVAIVAATRVRLIFMMCISTHFQNLLLNVLW